MSEIETDGALLLAKALAEVRGKPILFATGAGISAASGIPTFRGTDAGAVWKRDVTELGTLRFFRSDPVESWRWYLERFEKVFGARPNAAHKALADLERAHEASGGSFLLVTQNIDTLHEQAGSRALVKVHGSADRVRCASDGCSNGAPFGSMARDEVDWESFVRNPCPETLPRCPECGDVLRQHVLWFDEYYLSHEDYEFERACGAAEEAALFVFAGTSFSVGITDILVRTAVQRGVRAFSIDPAGAQPSSSIEPIREPVEQVLPAALALLATL